MEIVPDHPIIRAIEKNGEQKPPKVAYTCSVCDEPIYVGEWCYFVPHWGWVHRDCIRHEIAEVD